MAKNDFFLQQIEGIANTLAFAFFGKKPSDNNEMISESPTSSEGQTLLIELRLLIAQGRINEAENLMFERMEEDRDTRYMEISQQFYAWLEALCDEQLNICEYSRAEIEEGRCAVALFYNQE